MKILFHICCGNCTIYPFKILTSEGHEFAGLWFNPNIHPLEEYNLRLNSLKKLSSEWKIDVIYFENYTPSDYFDMFKSPLPPLYKGRNRLVPRRPGVIIDVDELLEEYPSDSIPPFRDRCRYCYQLRLEKTAQQAQQQGFDAFSTTLLISPYQDFEQIISTGEKLAETYNVLFYLKDFRPFFRDTMNLAKERGLYRQNYCGCIFSREERYRKKNQKQWDRGTRAQRHKLKS